MATSRQSISADGDPVLRRAERVLADVARVMPTLAAGSVAGRRRILSLATDLELLIRVLTTSRDALGLELAARSRHINAIAAYGRAGAARRDYARDLRRRTCTE